MSSELVLFIVERASLGIELLAVLVIVVALVFSTGVHVLRLVKRHTDAELQAGYERYRRRLGEAMLLGLEMLVAADIVRTVALDDSIRAVAGLAVLVVIRTVLSWSLVVEIEGRWPWQRREGEAR